MQIPQTNQHKRTEFLRYHRSRKTKGSLADCQVHHLGDRKTIHCIPQGFRGITQSSTSLTNGLDRIHKSHIRHDHAFSPTNRATAFSVKREHTKPSLTFLSEKFTNIIRNSQISGRSGTQADPDILLADINHLLGEIPAEAFHQRAFP